MVGFVDGTTSSGRLMFHHRSLPLALNTLC